MKTKLYIVRHTETIGNVEKRLTGRKDYELTEKGNYFVKQLTQRLQNVKFDAIYSSTLARTAKTIKPLAEINNLPIQQKDDLCEMYFGIYDGWTWEEVNEVQPEIKQNQIRINEIYGIDGQESMKDVGDRMYKCIEDIAKENSGKNVLICSHGVAIECFLRKITNIPFNEKREEFCQHNTAVNQVDYENGVFTINVLASMDHIQN